MSSTKKLITLSNLVLRYSSGDLWVAGPLEKISENGMLVPFSYPSSNYSEGKLIIITFDSLILTNTFDSQCDVFSD